MEAAELTVESSDAYAAYISKLCAGCGGEKRRHMPFCLPCYQQLPKALKVSTWKKFGHGYEEAYQACLSWFREYPLQGEHRAKQRELF